VPEGWKFLGIELNVTFEFASEIVAKNKAGEPAVRSFVHKLIADLVIHIDRANLLENSNGRRKDSVAGVIPRRTASSDC